MKMQKLASKQDTVIKRLPVDLLNKLNGLTLNEAFEKGLITDIGTEEGDFIKAHASDDIDAHYAIIQGGAIPVSRSVVEDLDNLDDYMGDLTFYKGTSNVEGDGFGKEWFRLGKPAGLNLGETVKSLSAEPANAKK